MKIFNKQISIYDIQFNNLKKYFPALNDKIQQELWDLLSSIKRNGGIIKGTPAVLQTMQQFCDMIGGTVAAIKPNLLWNHGAIQDYACGNISYYLRFKNRGSPTIIYDQYFQYVKISSYAHYITELNRSWRSVRAEIKSIVPRKDKSSFSKNELLSILIALEKKASVDLLNSYGVTDSKTASERLLGETSLKTGESLILKICGLLDLAAL